MKLRIAIGLISAALVVPATAIGPRAQTPEPSSEAVVEAERARQLEEAQRELERNAAELERNTVVVAQNAAELERSKAEIERKTAAVAARARKVEAQREQELAQATAPVAEPGTPAVPPVPALATPFPGMLRRSGSSGKALVIRSSETDTKEQGSIEEDLAVMTHILDKALEENVPTRSRGRKAMGIDVFYTSSSSPFRSMYLEGYGAVFMLRVSFPLLQPTKSEPRKERAETSSTWEEARQELYGHPETKASTSAAEEYDEDKVTELKDAVLEALKNAANIRDLKPDDSVTVCVFGGAAGPRLQSVSKRSESGSGNPAAKVWLVGDGRGTRGSVMTIRVKKSDAEAFAKGKQTLDEFRKKAKIATYAGSAADGAPSAMTWSGSGFGSGFEFEH